VYAHRLVVALAFPLLAVGGSAPIDPPSLALPAVGTFELRVIAPSILEVEMVSGAASATAPLAPAWNFTDGSGPPALPLPTAMAVTVAGRPVLISEVGFKRRVLYAAPAAYDLRVGNWLYLRLAGPGVPAGVEVEVSNPNGKLWPANRPLRTVADPFRLSPAIHVNQEGYVPGLPKKAMVGYYLGSLGEWELPAAARFEVVAAATGSVAYRGSLQGRPDTGYTDLPTPYQQVGEADFTALRRPGLYRLVVPGLGASEPFRIDEGIAMAAVRTYALGLYHQRCGASNALPFTRFVHDACHTAPAEVPVPQARFAFTWATIAQKNADHASNPVDTAPELKDEASQFYPYVRHGKIDVSGGHHDAGDYSKYTVNSAALVHTLIFGVDVLPGVASLDNLGLPESGDGISDVLQEAKWEADYLAKLQDTDGGFYFLVYPRDREYESNVTPDHGDPQVVWPKNTAATAAAVAALAQCAGSPRFRAAYPAVAERYLRQARLGWKFLQGALAQHGREGAYQKITFYGDDWGHDDEMAWAACELYLATGEPRFQAEFFRWLPDPADPATFKWGWQHLSESWGNAIREYAFAARSGRLPLARLDARYLAACQRQVQAAGEDALAWSQQSAYATSFPLETKRYSGGGWYFSLSTALDMAVAAQLDPRPEYLEAVLGNFNYEAGSNPVNVSYLAGLGWNRPRLMVDQYAANSGRVLPPTGIAEGNVQAAFSWMSLYQSRLGQTSFPSDTAASGRYPFYDRWGDTPNVTTEFITVNLARGLLAASYLAAQTSAMARPWTHGQARIPAPSGTLRLNARLTLHLEVPGADLTAARIIWEGRDQQPAWGPTYLYAPHSNGPQWAEAEVQWPDGRRVFAAAHFEADSPVLAWVQGALPPGAEAQSDGGDTWTWSQAISSVAAADWLKAGEVAAAAGPTQHASVLASGLHEHWFVGASSPLVVGSDDRLFAYVYLDPAHPPAEVMLVWHDGSSWEHRAYWGANRITYGSNGSPGRQRLGALPAAGRWIRLTVPARAVGLAGRTVGGMGFSLYGGQATWDLAGKLSPAAP